MATADNVLQHSGSGVASYGLSPLALAAALHVDADQWPLISRLTGMTAYRCAVDEVVAAYFLRSLAGMGWDPAVGSEFTLDTLAAQLGVTADHRRFLGRILEILQEDGWIRASGPAWQVERRLDATDPDGLRGELAREQPWAEHELGLIAHGGEALPQVLRGRLDPLRVLFPGGSMEPIEEFYLRSISCFAADAVVAECMALLAAAHVGDGPFSVLEVGAGTCATTRRVLARLGGNVPLQYWVTDISPFFVTKAKQRFARSSAVVCAALDIERDPAIQGLGGRQFHVVVASNVLHATADLRETLDRLAGLLLPGGVLLMREAVGRQRVLDAIFGITKGWWHFADVDLRRDYPLLSRDGWLQLLEAAGFQSPVALDGLEEYPVIKTVQLVAVAARGRR